MLKRQDALFLKLICKLTEKQKLIIPSLKSEKKDNFLF